VNSLISPASIFSRMSEKLRELLEKGRDWERRPTNIPGVFVIKLPESSLRPASLAVELNPLDEFGRPTKKRPLLIRSRAELEAFRKIINDKRLDRLMEMLDEVNPGGGEEEAGEAIEV